MSNKICLGTWNNSPADAAQPPSNLTRFSRALSRVAVVTEKDGKSREIPQIVYYQKGVGTNLGDKYSGGRCHSCLRLPALYGAMVDTNDASIQARQGWESVPTSERPMASWRTITPRATKSISLVFRVAHTWPGAVAGLVCQWGFLTPRGMDNFTNVYNDFHNTRVYTPEQRRRLGFREPLPQLTVEIIGVWDTVGFQKAWLGRDSGERLELRNTVLHESVEYAFHALALDEEPKAFQPTLWNIPQKNKDQELLQEWFSRVHTGVGGSDDPRLSNISLAWMIAQCMKHDQLSFDIDEYLFDHPPRPKSDDAPLGDEFG